MGYVITYYTRAVMPSQSFHKTKKEAVREFSGAVKDATQDYKKSGYKKKGSIRSGTVKFEHPVFGVDCLIRLETN